NDSEDDMTYYLKVLEESNPDGAIIEVDGATPNRGFQVLAGSAVNKVLTVKKGTVANEYNDIKVVFQSGCDAIADTVTFTVKFIPSCSPIAFIQPEEKWVLNNSFNDTLPVVIGGYDINYESLQSIKFQYKASADPSWINLETFYKDTTGMNSPNAKTIPKTTIYTLSPWDLSQLVDADYDIRAVASCALADVYSQTFTGHVDRLNPRPFGEPEPIDKVLDANDQISIQFNEPIAEGKLSLANFDIRGVLNGTDLQHGASSYFDGDANHSMTVADGLNLSKSSFTVEFWAKRGNTNQEQVIFSQGKTQEEAFYIGFNAANQLKLTVAGESVVSTFTTTDSDWHHYASAYDANTTNVLLIKDVSNAEKTVQNSFNAVYQGSGEIKVGRSSFSPALPFKGNIHELRIWSKARTESQLAVSINKMLSGREVGLIANWRMDEAHGSYAKDNARSRHAYTTAGWTVEPSGKSFHFDGVDDNLEINGGTLAFSNEMDFTIEMWFKSSNGNNVCLLSNGKGNGQDANANGWSIGTDANAKIIVNNNGKSFTATDSNFFDNQWHHFALVVSRLGQTAAFVDGNRQLFRPSADIGWAAFGGAKIWVGARGWYQGSTVQKDNYFNGKVDEVRIWSSARVQDQLQRDMSSRLFGDEFGLQAYYPFETYKEIMGINMLIDTLEDQSPNNNAAINLNGAGYDSETPAIKLKRPVRKVNFKTTVNTDKIIFTIQDPSALVENCILDITVRDIQDLSGNKMQSPATWSAYINKNQVIWQDEEKKFTKELGAPYTFSTRILNNGGNQFDFTIGNIPSWLTADIPSGQIAPQSSILITFTVDPGVNIGQYNQDLYLTTSFGFDEVFALDMKVYKTPPTWTVDKNKFQHSMNIYGQLKIGNIFSTDENDILAAFVNGECRGLANVAYTNPALDLYEAYITVYSNSLIGENVTFQIWKANEGKIYSKVTPNIIFEKDKLVGSPSIPQIFSAANYVVQDIPLTAGWNWVSFNLVTPDLASVNTTMASIVAVQGDQIKGDNFYDDFRSGQWKGSLTDNGGIKNEAMYKIKLHKADTIAMQGANPDPSTLPISIHTGWNWIGFISQKNILLTDALGNFNASHGDLIKSQYNFSMYDQNAGWIGSLTFLKPGEGYMYKASAPGSFAYPRPTLNNLREEEEALITNEAWKLNRNEYLNNMSVISKVKLPEGQLESEAHMLGAFVNGTCRGIALPSSNPALNELTYFLTIYSNATDEKVEFKWVSDDNGQVYAVNEKVGFVNNNLQGTLSEPIPLTLGASDEETVSIYPNPIGAAANITVHLSKASTVSIEVYDLLGNKLDTVSQGNQQAGFANFVWNAEKYPSGIYFIKIDTGSKTVNYKVVK
ncbi:MAG: Fibronectin type domain protein, partial [Cytophagaceae bacterium]|nr:Fibronectin type domain protein [Cytophagaceae bacterium]